ncbi:MAG: fibronectin type III domain-containing protein [bacterium]
MFKKISILAALFIAIFAFNACDPTVTPTAETPDAIVLLQATSIDATTVGLRITGSPSETNALFDGYYLKITPGTFPEEKIPVTSKNLYQVQGLTEGTIYTFAVYAKYTNGEVSPDVTVKWSPATRYTADIRVYETASSRGSGITLQGEGGVPQTLTIGSGEKWDLCLDTKNDKFLIGSPRQSSYTDNDGKFLTNGKIARYMYIYKSYGDVNNLDDLFDTKAISEYANDEQMLDFTTLTTGFIFSLKTTTPGVPGYFAKILVKAENGKILQGTAPDRYVQLAISYQKVADVPYAIFGRSNSSSSVKSNNHSNK